MISEGCRTFRQLKYSASGIVSRSGEVAAFPFHRTGSSTCAATSHDEQALTASTVVKLMHRNRLMMHGSHYSPSRVNTGRDTGPHPRTDSRAIFGIMPRKKSSGKRTTIKPKGDARYIRRDSKGRIKESDDVGRSLKKDREKKAKKTVRSGYGDRGDQKR